MKHKFKLVLSVLICSSSVLFVNNSNAGAAGGNSTDNVIQKSNSGAENRAIPMNAQQSSFTKASESDRIEEQRHEFDCAKLGDKAHKCKDHLESDTNQ